MSFELPPLPYAMDALAPHISKETLEYHYGKHHAGYVKKLNAGVQGTEYEKMNLEQVVMKAPIGGLLNNAAQNWNHTFYWKCMSPSGGGEPHGPIADGINKHFGSFEKFKEKFSAVAGGHFASGWAWLVQNDDGSLEVTDTHDAGNPLRDGKKPILTCDVWEHAYYIDYRNARNEYIDAWWKLVNWDFANENLGKSSVAAEGR